MDYDHVLNRRSCCGHQLTRHKLGHDFWIWPSAPIVWMPNLTLLVDMAVTLSVPMRPFVIPFGLLRQWIWVTLWCLSRQVQLVYLLLCHLPDLMHWEVTLAHHDSSTSAYTQMQVVQRTKTWRLSCLLKPGAFLPRKCACLKCVCYTPWDVNKKKVLHLERLQPFMWSCQVLKENSSLSLSLSLSFDFTSCLMEKANGHLTVVEWNWAERLGLWVVNMTSCSLFLISAQPHWIYITAISTVLQSGPESGPEKPFPNALHSAKCPIT